jgi:hypothetical protein
MKSEGDGHQLLTKLRTLPQEYGSTRAAHGFDTAF